VIRVLDVVCAGILCADVLVKPVDALPPKGLLSPVDRIQLGMGGCAANAAVDLARLGLSAALAGKIGQDDFGTYLAGRLQSEKVNIDYLVRDPVNPTSASVVTIDAGGERSILHCKGANATFCYGDVNPQIFRSTRVLFLAGTFLLDALDGKPASELLKTAHDSGITCCCDTAWDSSGQWMATIACMLPYLDWFMPSYEEAVQLSHEEEPALIANIFRGMGVRNVIVKLGSQGCYVQPEQQLGFYVPAFNKIEVSDTSGAGDAFCAGFIAGLVRGFDVRQCAVLANAAGALCVTRIGTTNGVLSLEKTLEFIEDQMS